MLGGMLFKLVGFSAQLRLLMNIGGWCFYCFCIAGGMYNVIRNTQWAHRESNGRTTYINGDARDQYAAEVTTISS